MNEIVIIIFQLAILILSVMVHEVMHGYTAYFLGDMTAKNAKRLNFNPINHLDPFGSIILPLLLYMATAGTFVIGWAKPVPYNPLNLKNPKSGAGIIAIAGPLSNFAIAIFAALLLKINLVLGGLVQPIFLQIVIVLNLALMVFNLVPIPPLDGSKVLFSLLPSRYFKIQYALERYGLWILLVFIFFGFSLIIPVINFLYNLLA